MKKKIKVALLALLYLGAVAMVVAATLGVDIPVLNPKGWVAMKQRNLIVIATLLMLIVVAPVCIMTLFFAWKYRASNTKAKYRPDWDYHVVAESIWWGFPCLIILFLSILCWKSSHELDPFKPLNADKKPIKIQVVALQWKWLFIYPEEKIATLNFVQFPEQTPVSFEITSDAPMNSFWIPQLGGQIYAMSGMTSKLHLIADEVGNFRGVSANISGRGFAGMTFVAKSSTQEDFDAWVKSVQKLKSGLDLEEYHQLAEPSEYNPVASYVLEDDGLFDWIVMKYMMPQDKK